MYTVVVQATSVHLLYVILRVFVFSILLSELTTRVLRTSTVCKRAITSKIKHEIKQKTSPARLAQLLQPSLAFCFSLQPVRRHWLQAKTK